MTPAPPATSTHDAIRAFEARVDGARGRVPSSKTWVRRAVRRGGADRPPVRLRRLSLDIILRHGDALADLFVAHPDDVVHVQPYDMTTGYQCDTVAPLDPITLLTSEATWVDEWGTGWEHAIGGSGASPTTAPLAEWADLDDYLRSGMPDPRAPGRLDAALGAVAAIGPTTYLAVTTHQALWERFNQLRGMEVAFEDLAYVEPEAERLLEALTEYQLELIRRWAALGPVDAVFLTDDWGTQTGLMCSPATWRTLFGPRYRRLCDQAHALDLDVIFHTCGSVREIVGDLIDAGVDVIDPIQPEAMDLAWLAREYGGMVAFAGGIPVQRLPTMTPAEVREDVLRLRDLLAAPYGNALLLAPSNSLLADVPLANLEALFAACHGT